MNLDYPIIRDGFDIEGNRKIAKFRRRGDFTITLRGNLNELPGIEQELESISKQIKNVSIHCTKDI